MKYLLFLAPAFALWVTGCTAPSLLEVGPRYHPENVHAVQSVPRHVRRVAILPLTPSRVDTALSAGATDLAPVLEAEFRKSGLFEVVHVSEGQLRAWTGSPLWRADQPLPQNFFARVADQTGCDAVLFAALTAFRPYPPLAVGLELRMVVCSDQSTLWAVDETIDAGSAPVVRAAHDYSRRDIQAPNGEVGSVLQSPRRFTQFATATLMTTLPPREISLKKAVNTTMTKAQQPPMAESEYANQRH